MKHKIWADRSQFDSDPDQVRKILCCPHMGIVPMQEYIEEIERASGEDFGALRLFMQNALITQGRSDHLAARRLIAEFFAERAISNWKPTFEAAIAEVLDGLEASEAPDLMTDFASPLFAKIISRMVGFSDDDIAKLFRAIDVVQRFTEPMLSLRELRNLNSSIQYLDSVLSEKKRAQSEGPEDLFAYLHRKSGAMPNGMDLGFFAIAITASVNTPVQTVGYILYGLLMDQADAWKNAAEPAWIESNMERLLGLWSPTLMLMRVAEKDVELGGCKYAEGDIRVLDMPAANAKLMAVPEGQARQATLSFGAGAHKCPGEVMSRLLLSLVLPAIARRFPKMVLHKDKARFRASAMVQMPVSLPCELHGRTERVNARLVDVKDLSSARQIVMDNDTFMPPAMEQHLRALAENSGRDLSTAILIARNAMFFMSGRRHTRAREIVAGCLGGNRLPAWQPMVDQQVAAALNGLEAAHQPDLIRDFASPLFRSTAQPILGADVADAARFDTLAPILQDVLEPWLPIRELTRLQGIFDELLGLMRVPDRGQNQKSTSVFTAFMDAEDEDFSVDDIKALVLVLYGASFNLSHTLGNVLHWLLIQPADVRAHYSDPAWIARHYEQLISLCASPKYIYRMVRSPTEIEGIPLSVGETTRLCLSSINREVKAGHLAFGHGLHHCVGSGLTRMLLRSAVPALFTRYPDLSLRPQAHKYFDMSQTVAMAELPCLLNDAQTSGNPR
ncbi:cytochrome P450 [Breoghania sp.]|uniref:cytochrome P450 n=1 Tax=Breoghania sp. TaxID=2065378 RepID=UPI0029C9CDBF|nr:cytochrome P450 [Breoghania sp.]